MHPLADDGAAVGGYFSTPKISMAPVRLRSHSNLLYGTGGSIRAYAVASDCNEIELPVFRTTGFVACRHIVGLVRLSPGGLEVILQVYFEKDQNARAGPFVMRHICPWTVPHYCLGLETLMSICHLSIASSHNQSVCLHLNRGPANIRPKPDGIWPVLYCAV